MPSCLHKKTVCENKQYCRTASHASKLYSRWRRWRIVLCMVPHHLTWRRHSHVSPTCPTDAGSGPPPLNSLTFRPRRSTIGGRAFPVAGAKVWNSLPSDVTSTSSLPVFKNRLKKYLFRRCYETVWLWITFLFLVIISSPEQWSLQ